LAITIWQSKLFIFTDRFLGHRTSAMTDRYSHLADQVVTDAVSKVMTKLFR